MNASRHANARSGGFGALLVAGLLGAASCVFPARSYAGPVAGTSILNTATGFGTFEASGVSFSQNSNTVRAIVQPLEALRLVDPRAATVAPALPFAFAHRLTNLGNDTFDFRLDLANAAGDGFDAAGLVLVRDVDGDGVVGGADVTLAPGASVTLAPGAFADLLACGTVPGTAPAASQARLVLSATGIAQGAFAANVDTVTTPALAASPLLEYFTDGTYATPARVGRAGQPLFVQVIAPGWNASGTAPDSCMVTFASQRGGDIETWLAVETAAASGVFRVQPAAPTAPSVPPSPIAPNASIHGDRTVTVTRADLVHATAVPLASTTVGARLAAATLWIDPFGLVFDAHTDRPIANASVTLIDVTGDGNGGLAGAPARVRARDGVSPAPSTVVTDASGAFEFPLVERSTYRLAVAAVPGYRFPSSVAPAALPGDHVVDPLGSYGGSFAVVDSLAPVLVDLPLDGEAENALFVEKRALRPTAELGETVEFEVEVANRATVALDSVQVIDRLPEGFAYLKGSARLGGAALADPAGGGGPLLTFAIGQVGAGQTRLVRYRTRIGGGALDGDGVNRAWAVRGATTSNVASAKVDLVSGVFAEEATVLGTVFADLDGNGVPGPSEPGVPGVRIWLDDGSFTVTDVDGLYGFYGISPRTHALRVDPTTLPAGTRALATDAREGRSPGTRFADLGKGELFRADWAVPGDTALARVCKARARAGGAVPTAELEREIALGGTPLEARHTVPDARTLPATAITTGESRLPLFAPGEGEGAPVAARRDSAQTPYSLAGLSEALGPVVGFVDFAARDTLATDQATVRVQGPYGATFHLFVGGAEVPAARVGKKVGAPEAGVELWEYVGVRFTPGENVLRLTADAGGSPRGEARAVVVVPDRAGRIEIDAPHVEPADGFTPAVIALRVVDARGIARSARTLVTVEASIGRLVGDDVDAVTGGLQVALEGGAGEVTLYAQGQPGVAEVPVRGAGLEGRTRVTFVPDLRPFLAVGAVEAQVGLSRRIAGSGGATNPHPGPAFEHEIERYRSVSSDGGQYAAVHGALFMKGRVYEELLLTVGYDTDRPNDLRRMRDIQPDAFYPIYGDASVKGYDARSTNDLYARLDRRGTSLLYGDFVTPGAGGGRTLASYSRSLAGAYAKVEEAGYRFDAWTSRDRASRIVDEIAGRGISGPYRVSVVPFVENSERVEVITRDRDQPAVVLRTSSRQRFVDYEIDSRSGEILMRAPVPSLDEDLNPVYLRVTYEAEQGGEPFWVGGFEGRAKVTQALELGGSYVDDHDPAGGSDLRSVFAAVRLAPNSTFEAEYANSRTDESGRDGAGRFEWRHVASGIEARLHGASTGAHFTNPTSGYAPGRVEAGGNMSLALSPRTRLLSEALYTAEAGGGPTRAGVSMAVDRRLDERWRIEAGTRIADGADGDSANQDLEATLRAKLTAQLPLRAGASAFAEYEQDTQDWDRRAATLGAEYRLTPRARAYGRHEFLTGLSSPYALDESQKRHATVFGIDANLSPDARVFSEYRADGLFGAREGEAALGLANAWRLASGVRLNASLERVESLGRGMSPQNPGAQTAATVAVDYATHARWKGSARLEFRSSKASDGLLSTLAGAYRIDSRWSALGRSQFTFMDESGDRNALRERMQLGFAYRPGAGWDALGRYELRYESADSGSSAALAGDRLAHIVSFHGAGPLGERALGSLAWAGRITHEDGTPTAAHWLHGRAAWALARQWDAGLTASFLGGSGVRRPGVGAEVGRKLRPDLWLSLGYNLTGYADDELTGEEWTRSGVYLRVRARFDETLLTGEAGR